MLANSAGPFAQRRFAAAGRHTLLDLGKLVSFAMSILSLCALLDTGYSLCFALGWYLDAYYVPLRWRDLPH